MGYRETSTYGYCRRRHYSQYFRIVYEIPGSAYLISVHLLLLPSHHRLLLAVLWLKGVL